MSVLIILFFLLGIAAVVTGAAMIYMPAGIIAGGLGLIALAIILIKGSGPDRS
ncbi:MAG: hypothetical protein IKQ10_09890 [Oscillospiraceae bacterium]|nr:hypothetical protein [Oscillospiraceae bacterium]